MTTDDSRTPSLPRLPRFGDEDHAEERVRERRELVERALGLSLTHVGGAPVPTASARGKIENQVGYAQVPLGLAGPLLVDTSAGVRDVYVPMATTEGALVASYSRGMRLLRAGGAARARVVRDGLSQHPVLVYDSFEQAQRALERVAGMRARFDALVAGITKHGRLIAVEPELLGARLVLRLVFATGDAIGINMAAHAAELCSAELARASGARERYVHGQDVEKRANARALVEGRGRSVVCEARIPGAALVELARVEPEQILACWRTYSAGYAQLGTHNWTVQAANGLAAIFVACGQDAAYLTECATGWLDFEIARGAPGERGDLVARVHLPSLLVGTVGGGTGQGTAAECLDLLGVRGDGGAVVFAELVAAAVLAGDLSLLAAFCSHEFVAAHERLGRNRPA
jgi:hydroxymethylglutaryl-CoA reductase (NADPH)